MKGIPVKEGCPLLHPSLAAQAVSIDKHIGESAAVRTGVVSPQIPANSQPATSAGK
jgi:hypothetical protein